MRRRMSPYPATLHSLLSSQPSSIESVRPKPHHFRTAAMVEAENKDITFLAFKVSALRRIWDQVEQVVSCLTTHFYKIFQGWRMGGIIWEKATGHCHSVPASSPLGVSCTRARAVRILLWGWGPGLPWVSGGPSMTLKMARLSCRKVVELGEKDAAAENSSHEPGDQVR